MHPYIAIPSIALLVFRAWSNNSLTPAGIAVATLTAIIHAIHPWSIFFALLVVFFLGGTATTKVKHHEKAKITHSSTGDAGGEGPRTHVQVLANSAIASTLIALHAWQLHKRASAAGRDVDEICYPFGQASDLLVIGIIAQYACAAADTWASELGILSKTPPRLITSWNLRVVPPGTNGGVTAAGTAASVAGALTIGLTGLLLLPFCQPAKGVWDEVKRTLTYGESSKPGFQGGVGWGLPEMLAFIVLVAGWGALGSVLDSVLGATLQHTVIDGKSGKVVEGRGGAMVPVSAPKEMSRAKDGEPSRKVVSGSGILDNNGVNFLTSLIMSVGAMVLVGAAWGIPLSSTLA